MEKNKIDYSTSISSLHSALWDIQENINYIEKEFTSLNLPAIEHSYIESTCVEFNSTIYDVRNEIQNLADKLGMHPNQAPNDPDIMNPDPRVTMAFIHDWLWENIEKLHQTVTALKTKSNLGRAIGSAYILVGESAVNIFQAFEKIKNALATIEEKLECKDV